MCTGWSPPAWVTEWQYSQVRALLAARAELLIWLDLSRWRVIEQVGRRTLRREVLWNGNVEPAWWTIFTHREHILRWAWSTHHPSAERVAALLEQRPDLTVVRLTNRRAVQRWVRGATAQSGRSLWSLSGAVLGRKFDQFEKIVAEDVETSPAAPSQGQTRSSWPHHSEGDLA